MKKNLILILLMTMLLLTFSFTFAQSYAQKTVISDIIHKAGNQIEIISDGPLSYNTVRYPDNRLVMNIRNAALTKDGSRPGSISINNGTINRVAYSQFTFNPLTTRIVFHLSDEHEFKANSTGKSTIISFGKEAAAPAPKPTTPPKSSGGQAVISDIVHKGSNQIEIISHSQLDYRTTRYTSNRLVMDIKNSSLAKNGARPGSININNGTINRVSFSQFSFIPLTTRIVYHLTDEYEITENFTGTSTIFTIGKTKNSPQPTPAPVPTPTPKPDPAKPTVIIDPGHGGKDPGAVANGLEEKAINLQISEKLENQLKKLGYNVVMTRSSDEFLTLSQRSSKANNSKGEIFISIHGNSFSSSAAQGIETFHHVGSSKGKDLATFIQEEVIKATEARDRGVKSANFHVLRESNMPAVLLEVGFISNPGEAKKLSDSGYQDKITNGLIRGINHYIEKY